MKTAPIAHLIANNRSGHGKGASLADEALAICAELGYRLVCYDTSSAAPRISLARYDQDSTLRYTMVSVSKFERRDSSNWTAL